MNKARLQNCNILITRPVMQAQSLYEGLVARAAKPQCFPSLQIEPVTLSSSDLQALEVLNCYEGLIFTSQNAVTYGVPLIKACWPLLPNNLKLFAIGERTAKVVAKEGWPLPLYPELDYTTEGLLALPFFHSVSNKRFLIISGEGGRSELLTILQSRGARVKKLAVYRRSCPNLDIAPLLASWATGNIDIVLSFSGESLINLVSMLGIENKHYWLNTPLLVVSKRIQSIAENLGYIQQITVADNASDEAVIAALLCWKNGAELVQKG